MSDQTTISLTKAQKDRLDEQRDGMPWGKYLVSLLEEQETTVRIETEQANEIANMAADKAADRLVENFR